jgi:hypothetical protein
MHRIAGRHAASAASGGNPVYFQFRTMPVTSYFSKMRRYAAVNVTDICGFYQQDTTF